MQNENHEAPPTPSRRLTGVALAAGLLVVVLLSVLVFTREDEVGVNEPRPSPTSVGTSTTSVKQNSRTEIVERLKSILKTRDEAFRNRAAVMLDDVYTVDCPCLEGDRNAIKELTSNNYHVVGGATSIRVHKVDRVTERLWLVIADFRSAPLRVESESGELIRKEPAGSDLFQFALSKPPGSTEWLLGQATAYKDGSG
jgi:hypothetical protein